MPFILQGDDVLNIFVKKRRYMPSFLCTRGCCAAATAAPQEGEGSADMSTRSPEAVRAFQGENGESTMTA